MSARRATLLGALLLATLACRGDERARDDGPLFGAEPAAALDLRVRVEPTEVHLLDEVRITLDLYTASGVTADFEPAVPDGFRGRVERRPARPFADGTCVRHVLAVRPVEVGELTVPPFEVRAGEHVATTEAVTITVASVIGADAEATEVEAPGDLFPERTPWWLPVAGVAALALVGGLLWWRFHARPVPGAVPGTTALPPHVTALRALARLRNAPRTTPEEVERFYTEVSQVLRRYLEDRFGLHAPERTTEEFLPEVERSGRLDREQQVHMRQFLEQCDLVKFARVRPTDTVLHEQTFAFAESFVEATRPDRPPVSEVTP